jgi:hypothetical protein
MMMMKVEAQTIWRLFSTVVKKMKTKTLTGETRMPGAMGAMATMKIMKV